MGGSIRIGSVRGIPIRIHVTFLLALPFLALMFGRALTQTARLAEVPPSALRGPPFLWGLVVALALFASVLVHELAHSLHALSKGGRVREITLLPIGGVSQISEPPRRGRDEAVMALVGPLTSLALGAVFWAAHRALAATGSFNLQFAAFHLFYLNVVLGIFNLLPAFPMDGGRVLRGLLAERWGDLRATRLAATLGKGFAILFAIAGFLSANLILVLVAFFVYLGAEGESRGVLVRALLGTIRVRDVMTPRAEPVDASATVFDVAERMLRARRMSFPVVEGGAVVGAVSLEDVKKVPPEARARVLVADVLRRVPPLDAGDDAAGALRALGEAGGALVPVLEAGALVGVVTQRDFARALQLQELERTQHPPAERPAGGLRRAESRA